MFPNLKAEMARKNIRKGEIAKALGISQSTLSAKLNQNSRLKYTECVLIKEKFFPEHTIDYLFAISE